MRHLSNEQLVTLAEDPAAGRPAHLDSCGQCRAEFEALSVLFATMRRDRYREPSPEVVERACSLFEGRSRARRAADRLARWAASLVLDSGTLAPALAGVRGAAGETRQLLFSTEQADLDLSYPLHRLPAPLRGQVLPRGAAQTDVGAWRPVTLKALSSEEVPEITSTDSLGVFRFPAVRPGRYELTVELDDGHVSALFELDDHSAERS